MSDETRPTPVTRAFEAEDAAAEHVAGAAPTPDEEEAADDHAQLDPGVAEHAAEMYRRGAEQKGEGRID